MTSKDEALKIAIDKLENHVGDLQSAITSKKRAYEGFEHLHHEWDYLVDERDETKKAIQACKEALAEAEKQEPVAWMNDEGFGLHPTSDLAIPLYTRPAPQPAQEPLLITRIAFPESNIQKQAQEPVDGYNLVEILNDPVGYYPHNFMTHAEGNALLRGLCQEAADEIERLRRLTQPAQEPWGWYENHDIYDEKQSDESIALYTHPAPSREPLSDELLNKEAKWIYQQTHGDGKWFIAGVRYAEKAHGIGVKE